jgi:hypothetical protein
MNMKSMRYFVDTKHTILIGGRYRLLSRILIFFFFSLILTFIKNIENSKKYIISYS